MQIHELPTFTGVPSVSDYLVIDSGTTTSKVAGVDMVNPDELTVAEATTGTSTASRIVTPKVIHDYVTNEVNDAINLVLSSYKIVIKTVTVGNVAANSGTYSNIDVNNETGYIPVGILGYKISHYACSIGTLKIDSSDKNLYWAVRNNSSSAVSSVTIEVNVLYKKN